MDMMISVEEDQKKEVIEIEENEEHESTGSNRQKRRIKERESGKKRE